MAELRLCDILTITEQQETRLVISNKSKIMEQDDGRVRERK